ncbi:MAG: hypothetical protein KC657_09195 [Myxococcales bacterium]|nr:hypothetical protein [Myxococcales bacterium]
MTLRARLTAPFALAACLATLATPAGTARADDAASWDGKAPFSCSSGKHVLDGVTADLDGTAVVAHGTCELVVRNAKIRGGASALTAHGAAVVRVEKSELSSRGPAVIAHGSTEIALEGVYVSGRVAVAAHGVTVVSVSNASRLVGAPIAIAASGSARVKVAQGCSVTGGTNKSGGSDVAIE